MTLESGAMNSSFNPQTEVLAECRALLPGWEGLTEDQVHFEPPKGFSSFTMVVRPRVPVDPPGVLYRRLAGKDNAILDGPAERAVFLALGAGGVAPRCLHVDERTRLEELYSGRTLQRGDLTDPDVLARIGVQLRRFHDLPPPPLPGRSFFELLHDKWGPQARSVLEEQRGRFPTHERRMCDELAPIHHPETRARVLKCLPDGPLGFCHNDTYHGNIFLTDAGDVRLLDFEFSCLNHRAFDFSNLFAETVTRHGLPDPPHFAIAAPEYTRAHVRAVVEAYLAAGPDGPDGVRHDEVDLLVEQTLSMIPLSDYMYAMAALPLAVEPIQSIRFIPYAHQRFARFRAAWEARFGAW